MEGHKGTSDSGTLTAVTFGRTLHAHMSLTQELSGGTPGGRLMDDPAFPLAHIRTVTATGCQ